MKLQIKGKKMKRLFTMLLALSLAVVAPGYFSTAAAYTAYTSEAEFVANLDSYYLEDFGGFTVGDNPAQLDMGPVNGFAYTIGVATDQGLYIDEGFLSTFVTQERFRISFSGAPVTAVGGMIWAYDDDFVNQPANVIVSLHLAGGGTEDHYLEDTSFGDFVGITSTEPFTSVDIRPGTGVYPPFWPYAFMNLDDLYVGAASPVPVPGAVWLLGSGLVGLIGISRKRKN